MSFFQDLKARVLRTPSPQPGSRAPSRSPSPMPWNRSPSKKAEQSEKSRDYPSEKGASSSSAFSSTPEDSPPPYTPTATTAPPAVTVTEPRNDFSDNDRYANLANFDTVFLIDDSGSMDWSDRADGVTRQEEAREALGAIAEVVVKYDGTGIDMHFLNHRATKQGENGEMVLTSEKGKAPGGYYNIKSAKEVDEIFTKVIARGLTLTGSRLEDIFRPYRKEMADAEKSKKRSIRDVQPMNLIIITDGDATDDPKTVILKIVRQLEDLDAPSFQFGIQFFQIGSDTEATKALKALDDGLKTGKECPRDIVDTTPCQWDATGLVKQLTSEAILKVVLGAVDKRIDEMKLDSKK